MPVNSRTANAAVSSFMQGFSFIDDINARKRRESMLADRLEAEEEQRRFQRERVTQIDAERGADRASRLVREQRIAEANRILADPNASDADLEPFTDIPEVAAFVRGRRQDVQDRADLEILSRGEGLTGAVGTPGVGVDPAPVVDPAAEQGLSDAVQPAAIPANEFAVPEKLTDRELSELAITNPVEAAEIRDQQNADVQARHDRDVQRQRAGLRPGEAPKTEAELAQEKRRSQQDQLNQEWDMFLDINDVAGDFLRNLDPNILTAKYFDDRGNIDNSQMRDELDQRMAPHISTTIGTQQTVIESVDSQSPEARNARRKLSEAYGLANEIGIQYEPLRQNGVRANGLPINNGNVALTDSVVNSVGEAPGTSLPPNPSMTRADQTIINRGTNGRRVSERFAQAAFRQYKNGRVNFAQYDSLIRTGRLPQAGPGIEQTDPKKDTWAVFPDGRRQLIIPARNVPSAEDLENASRNLINKEGLAHVNRISSAFNTPDDPQRGTRLTNSFITALASNEQRAMQGGYDLSSVNDVGLLFQRWTDLHVFRDAYNDEWFANGRANPDFTEDYGTLDEALFNRDVDVAAASGEFEVPGSTTLGMGGDAPGVTPLKPRNPAVYDAIRQQFPEFAQATDEDIEAAIQEQER